MSWFLDNLFKKGKPKTNTKPTSYDTSKEETNSPQKVREGNESAAGQQRMAKAKGSNTPKMGDNKKKKPVAKK